MTNFSRIRCYSGLAILFLFIVLVVGRTTGFVPSFRTTITPSESLSQSVRKGCIRLASTVESESDELIYETSILQSTFYPMIECIQKFQPINPSDACRIFHGRGGVFSGCEHLTLDWFPPVLLLTSYNEELTKDELELIQTEVEKCSSLFRNDAPTDDDQVVESRTNLVYQFRSPTNSTTTILTGSIPNPHIVSENGMKFYVRLDRSRNHGIFLDMAVGRQWIREVASGKHVLNLFAYTCGFSIAALSGGAESVVNIDMASGALKTGQQNHELNQLPNGAARFLSHDIFKSWGKIRKLGPYDIIIADPPSFQKKSFVAKKDYAKLVRRLPELLVEGGEVLLCLNAPELDSQWLKTIVTEEAPSLCFIERLENPLSFPSVDVERSLKVLKYRLMKSESESNAE